MGVQQKLMRHARILITMNVYGNALMEAKREANAAVVSRLLRSIWPNGKRRPKTTQLTGDAGRLLTVG